MSEEKYDLVFKGQLVKSVELNVAKRNLAALFKITPEKTEALFSGKPVVLKRNLDADAANKYRVAIKKAGALVDLVLSKPPEKKQPEQPRGKAVFMARDIDSPTSQGEPEETRPQSDTIEYTAPVKPVPAGPEKKVVQEEKPVPNVARVQSGPATFSLAPAGAELLSASEKKVVPAPDIDVSSYTLKPEGGTLLNPEEYAADLPFAVEISDIDLAPAGADVLTEDERKPDVVADVDTSGLSLAEPGVRLAPPKPEPPRAPDVSSLSLVDES